MLPSGMKATLSPGTVVSGVGDHYFEGTFTELRSGDGMHWVVFENVTLGDDTTSEHILPLRELSEQIHENDLTVEE